MSAPEIPPHRVSSHPPDSMADETFVDLQTLSATTIVVCRQLVLKQTVDALGLSMHETTTYDDESNEFLTSVKINVPPYIRMPRLETDIFYGEWSQTSDAAVQSACFSALVYLQKVNIVTIDGIHSAELKLCRRKLLAASFWAEAFEDHAAKQQEQSPAVPKQKPPVKTEVLPPVQDTTKKCAEGVLPPPLATSNDTFILPNATKKEEPTDPPCLTTPVKVEGGSLRVKIEGSNSNAQKALFVPDKPRKVPWLRWKRKISIPYPTTARAAANRKNLRHIIDSNRSELKEHTIQGAMPPLENNIAKSQEPDQAGSMFDKDQVIHTQLQMLCSCQMK